MKVLYLLSDFVLPAQSGLRVRELSQFHLLSAMDEVESITVLTISPIPVPCENVRKLGQLFPKIKVRTPVVQPMTIRRNLRALINFFKRRFLYNEPYLAAVFHSKEMHKRITDELKNADYDLVYLSYLGVATYYGTAKKYAPNAKIVLEQHNIEWRIFDRLADELRLPMRQLVRAEAKILREYESKMMRVADSVISISQIDAQELHELSGVEPVVVPPYFELQPPIKTGTQKPNLGYIGHLGWQPNTIGLDWFCKEVWPLVRAEVPDAQLTIAGPGLSKNESGAVEAPAGWKRPGINIVGFVDNLDDLYKNTLAMIAPTIGGSGVRMKLLETMSAGMPTVTTPDGALGLNVSDGKELLISKDAAGFAERVVRVLSNEKLRSTLSSEGRLFIEENHSQTAAVAKMKRAFQIG